ncbi:MAG: lysophospholipid acyltransferase family protein [Mariprofundaceae bacterium]
MTDRLSAFFVPRLIYLVYLLLSRTIRWQLVGERYRAGQAQHFILSFWHARMLMMPYAFSRWQGYMLISEHRDGGFIADTMGLIGIKTVRGSTTRSGARAMLRMLRLVKSENTDLGITPDGPKGPREIAQPGTVQMSRKSGLPILPVCYATKRHRRARSWDRFYIPLPFTRGVFVFGEFVHIGHDEPMDDALAKVQAAMDNVQSQADRYFASTEESPT